MQLHYVSTRDETGCCWGKAQDCLYQVYVFGGGHLESHNKSRYALNVDTRDTRVALPWGLESTLAPSMPVHVRNKRCSRCPCHKRATRGVLTDNVAITCSRHKGELFASLVVDFEPICRAASSCAPIAEELDSEQPPPSARITARSRMGLFFMSG